MRYIIDKSLPLPLYYQLKQIIINSIDDNIYKEDEAIPTERELIEKYNVSRTTVRQALNELCTEGYLYRKKGVGTFVSSKEQKDNQHDIISPSVYKTDRVINRNGFVCKTKFVKCGVVEASSDVARQLKIETCDHVWYMDRIRYADKKAASFSRSYIRKDYLLDFERDAEDAAQNFYKYLDSKGLVVTTIKEKLIPGWADKEAREVLEIDKATPILIIQDTGFTEDGTVIEYSVSTLDVSFIEMIGTFKRG